MNEDYLWDRTGTPDPEIEELEDVLGTLRYQPRPLELPASMPGASWPRFAPALAIAATIVFAVLAASLWLGLHRRQAAPPAEIVGSPGGRNYQNAAASGPTADGGEQKPDVSARNNPERESPGYLANPTPARKRAPRKPTSSNATQPLDEMTATQRAEGEAAKEKVMLALRVASLKLNLAQRKTQGSPATNGTRNQHKLG